MTKKRNPNVPKGNPTPNAAKARRVEKNQVTRQGELKDLGGALKQFGDGLKKAVEKRQAEQAFKHFSAPVEDQATQSFSIPAVLQKPERMVKHGDRIQWFWNVDGRSVIATLIMEDSPRPEDWGVVHGSRRGEWAVDVIGPHGSACFQMNADQAKAVGEAVLSAVYWRLAYGNYISEYSDETDEAEVIQIYEKD